MSDRTYSNNSDGGSAALIDRAYRDGLRDGSADMEARIRDAWDEGYRQALVALGRVPVDGDPLKYGPPTDGPNRNPYRALLDAAPAGGAE